MSDPVVDALRLGKVMEREAIVAWLRDAEAHFGDARDYADDIESGEHLRDAPTEPKGPCGEVPGFACFCCEPKGHEGAHVCGCSTVPHVAWLRDFEEEVTKAANEERAAIVAWLRNCDGFTRFTVAGAEGSSIAMWDKNDYADAVEHGAHLAGDDE